MVRDRQTEGAEPEGPGERAAANPIRADLTTPAGVLALQRTAGNAAVGRMLAARRALARSIVTIHSPNDSPLSKRITRNCEQNLKNVKTGGHPLSADAPRGASISITYGPPGITFTRTPPASLVAGNQTLYILGHGSAEHESVADLDAPTLAGVLASWFGDVPYTGKIKLVSCTTAADWDVDAAGSDVTGIVPFTTQLANALRASLNGRAFQPSSVQGVQGICWVDEVTGKITSIDLRTYLGIVGVENAFKTRSRTGRHAAIGGLFPPGAMSTGKVSPAPGAPPAKTRVDVF
jgi:hypothetical protein